MASEITARKGFFTVTCVVQKIDRANGKVVESWGNYKIMFEITDGDCELPQNGSADQIAFAVLDRDFACSLQLGTSMEFCFAAETSQSTVAGAAAAAEVAAMGRRSS